MNQRLTGSRSPLLPCAARLRPENTRHHHPSRRSTPFSTPTNPTPLRQALHDQNAEELFRLLDAGADVNERDEFYGSLLDEAITAFEMHPRRLDIVKQLLARGADPKILTNEGSGPLLAAVIVQDAVIVELLIKAGADPNAEFDDPESVYDFAEFYYRSDYYDLDLPESPTEADKASEGAWLDFLDRLAAKYDKPRPDHVRMLWKYGAKRAREIREAKRVAEQRSTLQAAP